MSDTGLVSSVDNNVKTDHLGNTQLIDVSGSVSQNAGEALPSTLEEEKDDKSKIEVSNSELELLSLDIGEGKDEKVPSVSTEEKKENSLDSGNENEMSSPPSVQVTVKKDDALLSSEIGKETDEQLFLTSVETKKDDLKNEIQELNSVELHGTTTDEMVSISMEDDVQTNKKMYLSPEEPLVNVTYEQPATKKDERPKWMQEKEKCLNASIEERKKKRKCTELSSIETWHTYYNNNLNKGNEEAEAEFAEISNKVSIYKGDLTSLLVDAIVNAANEKLLGGGGVDGAIHSAAGPLLKEECYQFGGRSEGQSVITAAYNLPAKYVIHTVGPRGEKPDKLRDCYLSSLQLLIDENQRSIAFPCISTGIFGYPNEKAAEVVLKTIREWLEKNHEKVDRVIFCLFLEKDVHFYEEKMQQYFPMMGGHTEFPEDVAPENTSVPAEREQEDKPSSGPIDRATNHNPAIEHGEGETASLISTDQNESRWAFWDILCCLKHKKTS